jgi:hypothetical protein
MGNQVGKLYSELLKILINHYYIPMDISINFSKFNTNYQELSSVHQFVYDTETLFYYFLCDKSGLSSECCLNFIGYQDRINKKSGGTVQDGGLMTIFPKLRY